MSPNTRDFEILQQENQLLKDIIDHMHEGVYVSDAKGKILFISKEVERTLNFSRDDFIGKPESEIYRHIPEKYHFLFNQRLRKINKPLIEQNVEYYLKDGKRINLIESGFPFLYRGQLAAVYTIGRELKHIENFITRTLEWKKKIDIDEYSNIAKTGARCVFDNIIGQSRGMQETVRLARKAAGHNSNILIYGETGTGKELFAQSIHNASLYSNGPFIPINCSAIPENLLESILFGTVKGAFTGSIDMPGLFEQAQGGTVFLDEINSMPVQLQPKLLRVLQEKKVRRIGRKTEFTINCRVISATNIDPYADTKETNIRPDLLYRLATVVLNVLPLRDRKEDIEKLVQHFISKYNTEFCLTVHGIDQQLCNMFCEYSWPGNVRELENIIECSMNFIEAEEDWLKREHIPSHIISRIIKANDDWHDVSRGKTLRNSLLSYEKKLIEEELCNNCWDIAKAAEALGVARQNMYYRIRRFGLKNENKTT